MIPHTQAHAKALVGDAGLLLGAAHATRVERREREALPGAACKEVALQRDARIKTARLRLVLEHLRVVEGDGAAVRKRVHRLREPLACARALDVLGHVAVARLLERDAIAQGHELLGLLLAHRLGASVHDTRKPDGDLRQAGQRVLKLLILVDILVAVAKLFHVGVHIIVQCLNHFD